jgi:hypothetical protein
MTQLENINKEISTELDKEEIRRLLLATTFKNLNEVSMKKAIYEGMVRGFTFRDFLEKNVYAIPFKDGYSLVTSIDYARKVGMRSGIVGKKAPEFTTTDGKLESCTVTVQRKVGEYIGDFTATVYFDEYYKAGKNGFPSLWDSKPRTMIAKVAEMHAIRMACPEELSQAYVEEELDKGMKVESTLDVGAYKAKLEAVTTKEELPKVWATIPGAVKSELVGLKNELKEKFSVA